MDIGTLTGSIEIEDQASGALNYVIGRVKEFAQSWEGAMGLVGVASIGTATAIGAVTAAVTALGMRGTEVNNLTNSLERFTGSASAASEVLQQMREGTKGVVTDFELTERSTKLLAAGVKLTSADFFTLSRAADTLSSQGLGPTKNMLEMVSSAMLTGRTRTLEMAIGKIDTAKAEREYAAALNTTIKDLTNLEKVEAHRQGILEALNKRIKEAGEGNRDFANVIDRVVASVKNWFDKLAGIVATSPAVWRAIDAIGAAFNRVFGGTSQASIDAVVAGIEGFADAVTAVVPYIADFLSLVGSLVGKLWEYRDVILALTAGLIAYEAGVWAIIGVNKALAFGVVGITTAIDGAIAASITFLATWGPAIVMIASAAAVITAAYNAWMLWSEGAEQAADAAENAKYEASNLAIINKKLGTSYTDINEAMAALRKNAPVEIEQWKQKQKAVKDAAEEQERLGRIAEQQAERVAELFKTYAQGSKDLDVVQAAMRQLTPAMQQNHDVLRRVVPDILKLSEAGRTLSMTQLEMHARFVAQTLAINADMQAKLQANGITAEMVQHNLELGVSIQDMAIYWGVTETALNQYLASLEKAKAAEQGYASFVAAAMDEQFRNRQRAAEQAKQTNQAIADFEEDYQERMSARTQTESEKRIAAIKKEYNAKIVLLSLGKSDAEQRAIQEAAARAMALAIDDVNLALEQESALMAAGPLHSEIVRDQAYAFDKLNQSATAAAYGGLQAFFTTLGQISGEKGIGKFLTAAGSLAASLQSAHTWSQQTNSEGVKLGGSYGALSVVFNKNAESAQRWTAGLQAAAGIAQGAKAIWDATASSASTMQNTLTGAMAGAQAGAMFGPWGVAIGAAAGLVTGIIRGKPGWAKAAEEIGREFGVTISEELAKTIDENSKKLFKGARQASAIYSLKDIIAEGGGITEANVQNYTSKLRDVFVMLETGAFDAAQAVKVLDENFADLVEGNTDSLGFWSSSLKEIIALNDKFGTQSKAIADAIRGQVNIVMQSFNMILAGSQKARQGYSDIKKEIEKTTEEIKKLNEEPERGRGSEWTRKMEDAQKRLTETLKAQHKAGEGAIRELKDLGTIAAASFAIAIEKGASFYEALMAAQPGLSDLRHAYEDLGLSIEDPFVKMLSIQSQIMENQPGLIQGVTGLSSSIAAMTNLNMLNADSFAAMGRLAADMYTRIQAEVAAAGGSTKDALMPMQDYLHAAAKAAEEMNLPLDEHTQMMIQQSKDLGIWKDQAPTAAEAMQAATENLTVAIDNLTAAIGRIPTSVPNPFAGWEIPDTSGVGFDAGGVVGQDWRKRSGRDVIPAWLRKGEIVVTPEQMRAPTIRQQPEGGPSANTQPLQVSINVDGKKMTDVVINRLGGRLALGGIR